MGDPDGAILRAYEVRWPVIGLAKRATYVIGREKKILRAFRSERSMTAHADGACEFVAARKR